MQTSNYLQPRKRRDPKNPKPVAKRGRHSEQYRNRLEREMFKLGERAKLK